MPIAAPQGPGQMSAAVISMGGRHRPWQFAGQTQRPLESPLSLGRGRRAVQTSGGGEGAPKGHKDLQRPKTGTPQASHGTFLPSTTALLDFPLPPQSSVSLSLLSFSFSPLLLVSSVSAVQKLANSIFSFYPKETYIVPEDTDLSEREIELLTSCSSGSHPNCLEVPP